MTCPVARYLMAEGFFGPDVGRHWITLRDDRDEEYVMIPTSAGVFSFIKEFDEGKLYSDLIDRK